APSCHRPRLGPLYRRQARAAAVPVRFALSEAPPPNRRPDERPQTADRSTGPSSRVPAPRRALSRRAPRSPHLATSTRRARELAHHLRRQELRTYARDPRAQKSSGPSGLLQITHLPRKTAFRISPNG